MGVREIRVLLLAMLVLGGLTWSLPLVAAEKPLKMDEVVVSANRIEEKMAEVTSNITIIDADEIKQSAATNLGDLLAEKGVGHIQKYPGNLTSIGIRGFRTDTHGNDLLGHVLILLNGRRAGTGNVAKIMTKNIERIEIIRGPAAVQYGSAAMGGIVNVITRQGRGKPSVFLEGMLGSFNYQEGTIGGSGRLNIFDFSGSITSEEADDYDIGDGDKYDNTKYDNDDVSLNFGINFMPGQRLGVIYSYFDSDHNGSPSYFSNIDHDDYTDKKNQSIDIIYEGKTSNDKFSWMARYYNGKDDNKWHSPKASDPTGWDDGGTSSQDSDFEGAQVQLTTVFKDITMTAGFDWVHFEIDSTWDPQDTEYKNPAGFFLVKSTFFDERLILTGGVRYDDYKVEVDDDNNDESDDNWTFNFGAAYWLNNFLKLRAHYGEAFIMPSADQLAANRPSWSGTLLGNPNLDPETSKTYEAGLDFYYDALNLAFTYFYTHFKDKIQSVKLPGGISSWENIGDADISGLEGQASYDLGTRLQWPMSLEFYGNFVYLTKYEDDDNNDLLYVSNWNASYGINLSGWQGFAGRLNFAYTGKQDIQDWESGWAAPIVKKGGFTVADLTLSKDIITSAKYGTLTLRGEITNLFDKKYSYVKGFLMPGRSFYLGTQYSF